MQTQRQSPSTFTIISQLAAAPSGVLYRAIRSDDGSDIDVFVLRMEHQEESRWLRKRLFLTSRFDHPEVARVTVGDRVGDDQSYLLEPLAAGSLLQAVTKDVRNDATKLLDYGYRITSVIAAGHRLGLTHGDITPSTIRIRADSRLQFDYARSAFQPRVKNANLIETRASGLVVESQIDADQEHDVFQLASLLMWLFSGSEVDSPPSDANELSARLAAWALQMGLAPEERDGLTNALCEALQEEPTDRATVSDLLRYLQQLAVSCGLELEAADLRFRRSWDSETQMSVSSDALIPATLQMTWDSSNVVAVATPDTSPMQIGRFQILAKLGEGGMGEVYQAMDSADQSIVALKVLSQRLLQSRTAVRRFQKEARLLGQIRSPYVTNLLEVNEDQGRHYLVMEFVAGLDLDRLIRAVAPLDEHVALSIIADAARGLVSAHEQEIIHRDIKPANILLADDGELAEIIERGAALTCESLKRIRIKLSDFGLARQLDQSESMQMTQDHALLGTPHYMSPEQFSNQAAVTPATDVYALGVTLFQMLTGKLPFHATNLTELINQHCRVSPPVLSKLNSRVSDATIEIVNRALAKNPQQRYADAAQFLRDVERLRRGETTDIAVHPQMPPHHPSERFEVVFQWHLQSSAAELWPHVSNTERINRAVGVPSVDYETRRDDHGRLRKYGAFRMAGLQIGWEEHPFEWVEGQRLGILREFNQGPFVWFLSIVELLPQAEGGTLLQHTVRIMPRGLVGRLVALMEVQIKGKRNLDRVYSRIDQVVSRKTTDKPTLDPFTPPESVSAARRRRLEARLDMLAGHQVDPDIIDCLGNLLREAPAQDLARIRPLVVSKSFAVDADKLITSCLLAAKVGLLELRWDILCPTCRISSQVANTFRDIEDHARCEVCDLDFEVDLANSVEMIFRAHPEIREADLRTYCIGGPEHFPHVVLQVRLLPSQRVELSPLLSEGEYLIRSAQLAFNYRLRALPSKGTSHTEIVLSPELDPRLASQVRSGRNVLIITNDYPHEIVVRLERTIPMTDVVTAAQAASLPAFRELFPEESPQLGRLLTVTTITFLAIEIHNMGEVYVALGDGPAFTQVQQFQRLVDSVVRRHQGALIESSGSKQLFAFESPSEAVKSVDALCQARRQSSENVVHIAAAIHRGTALATSLGGSLTYFGGNVHTVQQLLCQTNGDELLMTEVVAGDPLVVASIQQTQWKAKVDDLPSLGRHAIRCQRFSLG